MVKRCCTCRAWKELSDFHKGTGTHERQAKCKKCVSEYQKDNALRISRYRRQHYLRHRDHYLELSRLWTQNNYEVEKEYQRNRHHTVVARDKESADCYLKILRCDPCSYCGNYTETVDHIDAVSTGGSVEWENFTASCRSCNSRKHTTPLLQFLLK